MKRWRGTLTCTAFDSRQFPEESLPEIVIAGRSNVGKSSLINSLIEQKIAHVSSKPGKTRSINFLDIDADIPFTLVDLPGYGFAARSKSEQNQWRRLTGMYLKRRENLACVIHLVDFRHGLMKIDRELQDWLKELDLPVMVVFTKVDKISRGKRKNDLFKYIKAGLRSLDVPILTSTSDKIGLDELRTFIQAYIKEWNDLILE